MTQRTVGKYAKPLPEPSAAVWSWDDRGRSLLTRKQIEHQYWAADALVRQFMRPPYANRQA